MLSRSASSGSFVVLEAATPVAAQPSHFLPSAVTTPPGLEDWSLISSEFDVVSNAASSEHRRGEPLDKICHSRSSTAGSDQHRSDTPFSVISSVNGGVMEESPFAKYVFEASSSTCSTPRSSTDSMKSLKKSEMSASIAEDSEESIDSPAAAVGEEACNSEEWVLQRIIQSNGNPLACKLLCKWKWYQEPTWELQETLEDYGYGVKVAAFLKKEKEGTQMRKQHQKMKNCASAADSSSVNRTGTGSLESMFPGFLERMTARFAETNSRIVKYSLCCSAKPLIAFSEKWASLKHTKHQIHVLFASVPIQEVPSVVRNGLQLDSAAPKNRTGMGEDIHVFNPSIRTDCVELSKLPPIEKAAAAVATRTTTVKTRTLVFACAAIVPAPQSQQDASSAASSVPVELSDSGKSYTFFDSTLILPLWVIQAAALKQGIGQDEKNLTAVAATPCEPVKVHLAKIVPDTRVKLPGARHFPFETRADGLEYGTENVSAGKSSFKNNRKNPQSVDRPALVVNPSTGELGSNVVFASKITKKMLHKKPRTLDEMFKVGLLVAKK